MSSSNHNPWYAAGIAPVLRPGAVIGDVFYVDGSAGSNSNNGLDPTEPLLTIKQAMSLCADAGNDTIVVLAYPEAGDVAGEDIPIIVDKDNVKILGTSYGHERADKYIFLCCGTTDDSVFDVRARNVEIAYFKLACGPNGTGAIELSSGINNKACAVHHCTFGQKNSPLGAQQYGIYVSAASSGNWLYVSECDFGSSITNYGIYFHSSSTSAWVRIERNVFVSTGGDSIHISGDGNYGTILDNKFGLNADTQGLAISFAGTAAGTGWWIDGNSANYGKTAMATNPYEDSSAGAGNDWGNNYKANTHIMPA